MFEYLKGYEIDGSDTSFYVVMPEREKILEVAEYFMSLPLFEKFGVGFEKNVWAPHRDGRIRKPRKPEWIMGQIAEHEQDAFYLTASCFHPAELSEGLKSEIGSLSAKRVENHILMNPDSNEDKISDTDYNLGQDSRNPSVGLHGCCDNFVLAMVVNYGKPEAMEGEPVTGEDGYVVNGESYQAAARCPDSMQFEITCGPSFVYEYAMYVINHLSARFPELVITGGLDCDGGFLHGCTYALSLYDYEILELEAGEDVEAVADLLQLLTDREIIFPCYKPQKKNGDYSYQYFYSPEKWYAAWINNGWEKCRNYTLREYVSFLEGYQAGNKSQVRIKEDCSLMFCDRRPVKEDLKVEWQTMVQVTAYRIDGMWKVELYVPYRERERMETGIRQLEKR